MTQRMPFETAVEQAEVHELEVDWDPGAVACVQSLADAGGMLLLGEMHGVAENPSIVYTLVRRFGFAVLALEWEPALEQTIAAFLVGDGLDLGPSSESTDGRITGGHFALFRRLHEESLLRDVICFSGRVWTDWNSRDEDMASIILQRLTGGVPTLVVAGNLHTRVEPMPVEWQEEPAIPMGAHLAAAVTPLMEARITYLSGSLFNLELNHLPRRDGADEGNRFALDPDGPAVFTLAEATPAIVPAVRRDPGVS